ncbi:biotin/lipoyl-binding protein [Roseovarius aquimarinus]|uniref:Biotin/lipoyl-binding protein n=1 Tax=Roseovarius aquimarinus TaxID=1229156 RepID=A0ABW7I664_9RHOB
MSALRHPDWHLFAEQKFRRRAAVTTTRQSFRGVPYIVLSDAVTGQHLRLSARAQDLWRMLDGRHTAQEIWAELIRRPASAPTQSELVEWFLHLVGSGLVLSDHDLDPRHLTERTTRRRSGMIEQRAASPLAIKLRLFDPDPFIRATWPLMRHVFTRGGAVTVAVLVCAALLMALLNAERLRGSLDGLLLSQLGLVSLALAYPLMKALHELSHCYALRACGGRVRECGVMLLVFFPVPYVEASEASALPDKRARMLVGAAGILAEVAIASVALILWLMMEPGIERALVFNFVIIGSVSTLLFNGNPLLKFDAYFVLADWLEMPNLAQRSGDYLSDRVLWRVAGLRPEDDPPPSEAKILGIYGVLSLAYRVMLTLTIALIVSNWFFVIGVALALWAVIMGLLWPFFKLLKKGCTRARNQNRGRAAMTRTIAAVAALLALLTLVPLPFSANGEGRIQPIPDAQIQVSTSGSVARVLVPDGATVARGTPILQLENSELDARLKSLGVSLAFLDEASQRPGLGPVEGQRLERERLVAVAARDDALERQEALLVRAPIDGRLSWIGAHAPIPGVFLGRGERVGHVVAADALEMVMALPAAYSGFARKGDAAAFLLADGTRLLHPLGRERIVDVGGQVPEALLSSAGGIVPEQPGNPGHALDTAWIAWADPDRDLSAQAGMRFDVRIDLGGASLARQAWFQIQRLLVRVVRL